MKKLLIRLSNERNRRSSIKTFIVENEDTGERYTVKEAVYPEGMRHLENMVRYRKMLAGVYPRVKIGSAEIRDGALWTNYIWGESLESQLRDCMYKNNLEDFFRLLKKYKELIVGAAENQCIFHCTPSFEEIFGKNSEFEGEAGLLVSNYDATAENIIFERGVPTFISCEWVFEFPMPRDLVVFHCIKKLYQRIPALEQLVSLQKAAKFLEIRENLKWLASLCGKFRQYISREPQEEKTSEADVGREELMLELQSSMNDYRYAKGEWEKCAEYWQAASEKCHEQERLNRELEAFWKQSSQANTELNRSLQEMGKKFADKEEELAAMEQVARTWREAYESVIHSKSWRMMGKLKRLIGKKQG